MTATVLEMRPPSIARLSCSVCGAEADAACNCGAPYVPAGTRAAEAIAASPEKSNRAIAADIGVDEKTVRKVRQSTADLSAVAKRLGKDGKARKLPAKPKIKKPPPIDLPGDPIQETCADCETPEQFWQRSLSNLAGDAVAMRAFWTRQFGAWEKFEVTSELVTLAEQAAEVWSKLAVDLEPEPSIEDEIDPENYRTAFLLRAQQAVRFAVYSGPVTKESIAAARAVAAAWDTLARNLEAKFSKRGGA